MDYKETHISFLYDDLVKEYGNEQGKQLYALMQMCIRDSVYTVEGNSGDACRQNQYTVGSSSIYGYGVPAY